MTARLIVAATAAALLLGMAPSALAEDPNDALPEGPAKAVIIRACTACHDASPITGKARTPEAWEFLIGKMMDDGAELTSAEQDAVYAYVVKNFGVTPAAPTAASGPKARASR